MTITPKKRAKNRRYYEKNAEKLKDATYRWRKNNPEKQMKYARQWRERNLIKARLASRKWYARNKEAVSEQMKRWGKANPHKVRALSARRYAAKFKATPKWLTDAQYAEMESVYKAAIIQGLTVDHIIPIRGRYVCGLHVPSNLQLLSLEDNMRKHNHFDI